MRTPQQTPQTPAISTPSVSDDWGNGSAYESDPGSNYTPYTTSLNDFGDTMPLSGNPYRVSLFPRNPQSSHGGYGYDSPELNFNVSPYVSACSGPAAGSMNINSPYGSGPSYFDAPVNQAYSNEPAFNVAPSNPLHIGLNYHGELQGMLSNGGGHSLQPQSRDPSISEVSPMITEEDAFHSPQPMLRSADNDMSNNYTGIADLPNDDFPLFGGSDAPSMVPSTADISAFDTMQYFGNMESEYSDSQLERYVNL